MAQESFWTEVAGGQLAQGDFLPECPVPMFPANFSEANGNATVPIRRADLIVVTQSCDLENKKVQLVAMCPILSVAQLKTVDERYGKPDRLEEIRKGRFESLHMLASTQNPENNMDVRIVDFREIHSLPVAFLAEHAIRLGPRWRLRPPFLEHFSQAFARFFMRVGLPTAIPRFK
jgi:hypothetical protein